MQVPEMRAIQASLNRRWDSSEKRVDTPLVASHASIRKTGFRKLKAALFNSLTGRGLDHLVSAIRMTFYILIRNKIA